jgi:8-oxo-dGTP pyrophosphatase MutT (NUDIX family)
MSTSPRIRRAARAIVLDRERRVLLVHFDFVRPEQPSGLWACPGGGVDDAESITEGLIRELNEEIGLRIDDPGSPVWWMQRLFPMTGFDGQHDTYFLIEVDSFDPRPHFTEAELRAEHVDGMRWWTYDEIQQAQARYDAGDPGVDGYVTFSPRGLGHFLEDLFVSGRPAQPIEVDAAT